MMPPDRRNVAQVACVPDLNGTGRCARRNKVATR
jgi:hypothetical protein